MAFPEQAYELGSEDLIIALRAADEAGAIIRQSYGAVHADKTIKGHGDVALIVDQHADSAVHRVLHDLASPDRILSEETPSGDYADRSGRRWIVDPLDSTISMKFAAGEQYCSVMVGLQIDGVTHVGVVHFPLTDEWFYAVRNAGAYKNGERICVLPSSAALHEAVVDMNHQSADYESAFFTTLWRQLRTSGRGAFRVTSHFPHSGIAMRIAEGASWVEAAIHDNSTRNVKQAPWDTVAPALILEEAGGVYWNDLGEPYDHWSPRPILAARSQEMADQILALAK